MMNRENSRLSEQAPEKELNLSKQRKQAQDCEKQFQQDTLSSDSYEELPLSLPMNKTSPLVWTTVVLAVVAIVGGAVFLMLSRQPEPKMDYAAELEKAQNEATKAKQQQQKRLEHLQQAAKAWQMASEQADSSPPPTVSDIKPVKKQASSKTESAPRNSQSASGSSELDQLEKLGNAVKSELAD